MWKFALVLAVVHGVACIAQSTYWVLETLKCGEHRVIVTPNRNLVETSEDLDQMCKRQDEFYHCLEKLVNLMEPASLSELSSEIASERSVFNSLCSQHSPWRRRYLELAPCINLQQTDFCKTPEFLGADGMDLTSSPCALVEGKMENCIAATLSIKCGVEAGQLFHYLLKLKGNDVCQPVEMTYTDADASSNGNHSAESMFDEIYDQLVKKIGYIPEQDSEESFVLHKRVGHMHEGWESVDETMSSSLEIEDSDTYSHFMEQDYSENVEHTVSEDNGSVSEVITSNLDTQDLAEKPEMSDIFNYFGLKIQDILQIREERKARGAHTIPSILTDSIRILHTFKPENYETFHPQDRLGKSGFENVEHAVFEESVSKPTTSTVDETSDDLPEEPGMFAIFKYYDLRKQDIIKLQDKLKERAVRTLPSFIKDGFRSTRTLNSEKNYETVLVFPDGRINYYSRRRDIQDLETIKCYNFPDYFVCINMPRSEYPRCLKTTVFTGPKEGKFFPEEIDPEFGAQWYETIPNEAYLFQPWLHQTIEDASDQLSYTSASDTEDTQPSYVPVNRGSEDGVELLEDVDADADTRIVSKDSFSFNIKDSDAYEFTTKENKAETIMHLFKVFTAALPSTSKMEIKNLVPENVAKSLENLHESNGEFFENVKIRLDKSGNLYIFWNNQQESVIDTITCGKVNECHPKGEGIWKCVIFPRPPIETDGLEI